VGGDTRVVAAWRERELREVRRERIDSGAPVDARAEVVGIGNTSALSKIRERAL
jgi:hypothetical protein